VKPPTVFVQVAFTEQLPGFAVHSLTSLHVTPLPLYPALQAHVKLPDVFVQVAFGEQLPGFAVHSLTSVQLMPSPL